jgi:hypothetical protein
MRATRLDCRVIVAFMLPMPGRFPILTASGLPIPDSRPLRYSAQSPF